MSVAFTKEESAETAAESLLPDRPISNALNLVTQQGLDSLKSRLLEARMAYESAQTMEDVDERRRQSAVPLRDMRYYAERVRTAHLVHLPTTDGVVTFGSTVTFQREDGRVQTFKIVGEDEADPKAGSISHASPIGGALMGKEVGEVISVAGHDFEIISIR